MCNHIISYICVFYWDKATVIIYASIEKTRIREHLAQFRNIYTKTKITIKLINDCIGNIYLAWTIMTADIVFSVKYGIQLALSVNTEPQK